MANPAHLAKLEEGVEVWNQWRKANPPITPALLRLDLNGANFRDMDLQRADLSNSRLCGADLRGADLSLADLSTADLNDSDLTNANLTEANLFDVNFFQTTLVRVEFFGARIRYGNFQGADLTAARFAHTSILGVDLSGARGLERVVHVGPCPIDVETLYRSRGKIPTVFLRGCGVPENLIEQLPCLIEGMEASRFSSSFICHSHEDEDFCRGLHARMQQDGLRVWFAPEDLKIGDQIRPTIEREIRLRGKLIVVLSKHSLKSGWVKNEVEAAFSEERRRKTTVLFPIRLDDEVMDCGEAWAATIHRERHIGDFRRWRDPNQFEAAFKKLVADLREEKGP